MTFRHQNGTPADIAKVIAMRKEPIISKQDLEREDTNDANEHVLNNTVEPRIIQSMLFGKTIYFNIHWDDGTCSWESKHGVPRTLLKNFYVAKARKLKHIK